MNQVHLFYLCIFCVPVLWTRHFTDRVLIEYEEIGPCQRLLLSERSRMSKHSFKQLLMVLDTMGFLRTNGVL